MGEFVKDVFQGEGTYIWSNKDRYQGNFIKGMPQGRGKYIHADGIKFEGVFRDGLPWRGQEFDQEGREIQRYSFGKPVN